MREIVDVCGYEDLLKEVFPNAIMKKIGNYDDYYWGWDIVPEVGVFMQFMVSLDHPMFINILERGVSMYQDYPTKVVFRGDVPFGDDGPDFDFLGKVLRNYRSFSR